MNTSTEKIVKSSQEQAVASWINYLNQTRIDGLLEKLNKQNINVENARQVLNETMDAIKDGIIDSGRGGETGMHGFIAEVAEKGIRNCRELVRGNPENTIWVNDNGPIDLIRDGVNIQQKFYQSGDAFGLSAMLKHLEKYPDYIKDGGVYQIPKDKYDKLIEYLNITEQEANKMPTADGSFSLKEWKKLQEFVKNGDIPLDSIEPSTLKYNEAQKNNIAQRIEDERKITSDTDSELRKKALKESQPTSAEGIKATVVAAAVEGGTVLVIELVKKIKEKHGIKKLTSDDWEKVFRKSGIATVKGGIRGAATYIISNFTATSTSTASALVSVGFGIADQIHIFNEGKIDEVTMLENCEVLCLDMTMSALFSIIGQIALPIPVLGAIIGNTIGMVMYNNIKSDLFKKQEYQIDRWVLTINELQEWLDNEYASFVVDITKTMNEYFDILSMAFSVNREEALNGSITLAEHYGVPHSELLHSITEIDEFFIS